MLHREDELLPTEPAQGFVFLPACLGDILGPQALLTHLGVVGFNDNPVPAFRVLYGHHRRHLHIVRQQGHQGIGSGTGVSHKVHVLHTVILPLGNGTQVEFAQGALQLDRRGETFQGARLPSFNIGPGIKGYTGFRKPVIGLGKVRGRSVSRVHAAKPFAPRQRRTVEP